MGRENKKKLFRKFEKSLNLFHFSIDFSNIILNINVIDGDIGYTSNANPGFTIDASTRDYTDSLNVNVLGSVTIKAVNDTKTDDRLINIRAKQSDLNIDKIETDGNVILTAADWKQADVRPVDTSDEEYFKGYSILNARNDNASNILGKNISIIASDNIGSENKKLINEEDTRNGINNVSLSAEAENNLYLTGRANSVNPMKINQMISKHGDTKLDLESNAVIEHITADDGLEITQKAQNLTIKEFGTSGSASDTFNDILYPHDDITFTETSGLIIPKYVNIQVLDAIDTTDRANSTLKIYSGYVRGNNGDNLHYYPNGARLADITIMADNIYAMSNKMQSPTFSDRINLGNTDLKYILDGETEVKTAKGLNAYGEGSTLTLDILGVDKDVVSDTGLYINRTEYNSISSNPNTPSKFINKADEVPYYGGDYAAKNVVISVNDYSSRNVNFDTLYADNTYIGTNKENLNLDNAYVKGFAEFKNSNKTAVVDNERIGLLPAADIQLYTQKTGSFALGLDRTINMTTTAPTVYNNPHMLVNGYHSEWNFVNKGFKETQVMLNNIPETIQETMENELRTAKPMFMVFDVSGNLADLNSDTKIYSISTTGALIANDKGLKNGDTTQLSFTIDGINAAVEAKVINAEGDAAQIEFVNLPRSLANKLLYKYMQANSEEMNLIAL